MDSERLQMLEVALERVATDLGDPTAPIMTEFYNRFPDARASFEHHWPGKAERLEAEMVGNVLYFLMTWYERQAEVEIAFASSVPHHEVALAIPPAWYGGMIAAAITVLSQGAASQAERAMWQELHRAFGHLVESSR